MYELLGRDDPAEWVELKKVGLHPAEWLKLMLA
jgi:hypothetical protein